jgi:hypothetical protein
MKLAHIGDIREKKVTFTCKPWQPPLGGKSCGMCGKGGVPCSKYGCESLGQTCKFVNEETGQENCIDASPNDVAPPVIRPWADVLSAGLTYSNGSNLGFIIKSASTPDGCIPAYTQITTGISLDKAGKCKYAILPGVEYKDMELDIGEGLFKENQTILITVPSAQELGLSNFNPGMRLDSAIYIRCENGNGIAHSVDYKVEFCMKPTDDLTAPMINYIDPNRTYIAAGAENLTVSIYTNEPTDCKWDAINTDYDSMKNNMTCLNDFTDQTTLGWRCLDEWPVNQSESTFYVRCLDQPWEIENMTKRNPMLESKEIKFIKTAPLEIISMTPAEGDNYTFGTQPGSVNVSVETKGGVDNTAECRYSFDGENFIPFFDTNAQFHRQVFENFMTGQKNVMLQCEDLAENIVEKNMSFYVYIDADYPLISRIYIKEGSLFIRTNEPSTCKFSVDKCNFDSNNATAMAGAGIDHITPVAGNFIYYIKCEDTLGNRPGECSVALKPMAGKGGFSLFTL